MNFRDCQLEAWLLIEKFSQQVPIFKLIPLSLARGSGLRGLIVKEPQCGNIGKQIESTVNCKNPFVWPPAAQNTWPFLTFPTKIQKYPHCLH